VRGLQQALGELGQDVWIDSRGRRGGDLLWPEIQKAIEEASAYAAVVSPASLQSKWVGKELRHALDMQKQHGKDRFPVIPLSLDGTKLGVLEEFFGQEPVFISVSSAAGGSTRCRGAPRHLVILDASFLRSTRESREPAAGRLWPAIRSGTSAKSLWQ
jgi:hypothetical protein